MTEPKQATGAGSVAVTHHHLATEAALEMIRLGGSAVDAAIAANAVVGVVLPTACGVGGDLFALIHQDGQDRPDALNASGRAGSGADAESLREAGHERVPYRGAEAITVPGCVDGWLSLSDRYGRLPLPTLLQPAIRIAREGFEASGELARSLQAIQGLIEGQPSAPPLYPRGEAPKAGAAITRLDLADTLAGIAAGGREAFYQGEVGRAIREVTAGRITPEDLEETSAEWIEPLGTPLFDQLAWTIPPNSQGYLTLATLWLAEELDLPRDFDDPRYTHLMVEAYRAVAWERDNLVADPDTAPLPPDQLVDPGRLRPRLDAIDPWKVSSWPEAAAGPGGTTYLCVTDDEGLAISLIQSNFSGIGSGISAGATGVFLQNRGAGFNLTPGHPNELQPGNRPLHTLSPTLWTLGDRTSLVLGTRGGHWQPQLLAQVSAHLFVLGDPPDRAQRRPRWTLEGPGGAGHVRVEGDMPASVVEGLAERGHQVEAVEPQQIGWGPISLISIDETGRRRGAAEPRIDTATVGAL